MIYYNDNDPYACQWLRNLMEAGEIPQGRVHEKSIREVKVKTVRKYTQCHFFAGIGGWGHALSLAGVGVGAPLWTASCPCQPFSTAGKRKGEEDERHLWPALFSLVRECLPPVLVGEQVASDDGYAWLDGVRTDLEGAGYAFAAADLPAAGAGAPHIRQRLYWGAVRLAEPVGERIRGEGCRPAGTKAAGVQGADGQRPRVRSDAGAGHLIVAGGLEHSKGDRRESRGAKSGRRCVAGGRGFGGLADADGSGHGPSQGDQAVSAEYRKELRVPERGGKFGGLGDADGAGFGELRRSGAVREEQPAAERSGGTGNFWSAFDLVPCRDDKVRRVEPGSQPLAHGVPRDLGPLLAGLDGVAEGPEVARQVARQARRNRVGRLRGYGNAIVPEVGALFLRLFLESASARGLLKGWNT